MKLVYFVYSICAMLIIAALIRSIFLAVLVCVLIAILLVFHTARWIYNTLPKPAGAIVLFAIVGVLYYTPPDLFAYMSILLVPIMALTPFYGIFWFLFQKKKIKEDDLAEYGALGYATILTKEGHVSVNRDGEQRNYTMVNLSYVVDYYVYFLSYEEASVYAIGDKVLIIYSLENPENARIAKEWEIHQYRGYEKHLENLKHGTGYVNPIKSDYFNFTD